MLRRIVIIAMARIAGIAIGGIGGGGSAPILATIITPSSIDFAAEERRVDHFALGLVRCRSVLEELPGVSRRECKRRRRAPRDAEPLRVRQPRERRQRVT